MGSEEKKHAKTAGEEIDTLCLRCARWHSGLAYSVLLDAWIGRKCLRGWIADAPEDKIARLVADELNLDFGDAPEDPTETICDFCGEDEVIGSFDDRKICLICWNKIKP